MASLADSMDTARAVSKATSGKQPLGNSSAHLSRVESSPHSDAKAEAEIEYEFEDPARCWIDLVEATRELNVVKRKQAVYVLLNEAKNSHWTHQLWDTELELQQDTVEYGGEFEQEQDTEPYSDPEEGMNQVDRDV